MPLMSLRAPTRALLIALACAACACGPAPSDTTIREYGYEVVHTFPHDTNAFTEGLFYLDGFLYESTGLEGQSSIRKVRLETGEILQRRDLSNPLTFGAGIVNWKDRLLQLTWQGQVGFIYDLATFAPKGEFHYTGEGWALTHDGKRIIMSDGTSQLRFLDPDTQQEPGRLNVSSERRPNPFLNALS